MTTTQETIRETGAETAKRVRKELREKFAGVKFSVRCTRGGSLRVAWTDGPAQQEVRAATWHFAGADFDGMTDMRTYRGAQLYGQADGTFVAIESGVDFVLTSRSISQEWREEVAKQIEAITGEACDLKQWGDDAGACTTNGAGWDTRYEALVIEESCSYCCGDGMDITSGGEKYCGVCNGTGRTKGTARIVRAVEGTATYGRDLFAEATKVTRS